MLSVPALIWLSLGILLASSAWGQESAKNSPGKFAAYDRTDDCRTCHAGASGNTDFVLTIPTKIWDEEDKHSRAFALLGESKVLVTQILGFDLASVIQDGQIAKDADPDHLARVKQCLACHATWPKDRSEPPVELKFGVSCQACHGPGFNWSRPHRDKGWRLCTPEAKELLGMVSIRDPIVKANLCQSCHVGNVEEERFVTHEMYAAGHPPLPGFEYGTYTAHMPRHWKTLVEKVARGGFEGLQPSDSRGEWKRAILEILRNQRTEISEKEVKASFREANYPDVDFDPVDDLPITRGVLVSGLVLPRTYANLTSQVLAPAEHANGWPEFAAFDCTGCHHELRPTPYRTNSPTPGLGRPRLPTWPFALAQAGLPSFEEQSASPGLNKDLQSRMSNLESAVVRRPFGDRPAVRSSASELTEWLDGNIARRTRTRISLDFAKQVLRDLTAPERAQSHDYYSARQLAWTIRQIVDELATRQVTFQSAGATLKGEDLFLARDGSDPLALKLPSGQQRSVVKNLAAALQAIDAFDAQWFAGELQKVHAAIGPP